MTRKVIISLFLILIYITSCRFKEGPLLSFRSVKKRLEGTWQVTGFSSEGVDSLKYYNDSINDKMIIRFPYDSKYYINFEEGKIDLGGTFTFAGINNKLNVVLVDIGIPYWGIGPIGSAKNSKWDILKLTMNDLKISSDFNGKNYIISFKKI